MRIKRANFRFNQLVNVDDIIGHSNLLLMEQEDINVDNNVHDCILEDNANIMVLQNDIEPHQNVRYCYIKYHTIVGGYGNTKLITIDDIIVDENLISYNLFAHIFTIFLRQEDNEHPNRIVNTNGYNERFRGRIVEVANDIANRICGLYNTFINDNNTSYVIQESKNIQDVKNLIKDVMSPMSVQESIICWIICLFAININKTKKSPPYLKGI